MKVTTLDESIIQDIGHAFGYYDYGAESGLITAFPSRDAAAAFICGYVRMALQSGILYTTGERKGVVGPHMFGYNKKQHILHLGVYIPACAAAAWLCTLLF